MPLHSLVLLLLLLMLLLHRPTRPACVAAAQREEQVSPVLAGHLRMRACMGVSVGTDDRPMDGCARETHHREWGALFARELHWA